jgi:mono/diheme cytochrome c family protein
MYRIVLGLLIGFTVSGAPAVEPPRDATPLDVSARPASWSVEANEVTAGAEPWPLPRLAPNTRLHFEYAAAAGPTAGTLHLGTGLTVPLDAPSTDWQTLDLATEHLPGKPGLLRVWRNGREVKRIDLPPSSPGPAGIRFLSSPEQARSTLRFDRDFTVVARFRTTAGGTLVAMAPADGPWAPDAKALFIRDGRLVYDVGWLGAATAGPAVNDDTWHTAALVHREGTITLHLDGQVFASRDGFTRPDVDTHRFKIGAAAPDFAGDFTGDLEFVRFYARALAEDEVRSLTGPRPDQANTPDFEWSPTGGDAADPSALRLAATPGLRLRHLWSQPLDRADHATLIANWNEESLARGATIYSQLCVVCHGTLDTPGSLPTAPRFAEGPFKNGSDPHSLFNTLTHGYGQMVAQPQYTARQKYDVIHYIRETFLRHRPAEYTDPDARYLARLPIGMATAEAEIETSTLPPYRQMDFGPSLMWTLEVAPDNIAQKGIAVRLDPGPGGISQGHDWMLYDHDTLRVAAAWSGDGFVDWKGIAFDGSHQTHTSIAGTPAFINPPGPGWAHPVTGSWQDPRPLGRDGRPYGPLPPDWARYRGLFLHDSEAVLRYTVGTTEVLDSPALIPYGSASVFVRTLNLGPTSAPLSLRLAPHDPTLATAVRGPGTRLETRDGFTLLQIARDDRPRHLRVYLARLDAANLDALIAADPRPLDLAPLTRGGPPRWNETVTTRIVPGETSGAFAIDTLTLPEANPWHAWMRTTGFDFFPGGRSAAVCTWNGDVWRVDGVDGSDELRWRRLATGLFQPLGVKFRDGDLFVCCRDQIVRLRDLNGDGETDFVECFNNDHQVTEHFHEFAMGLQTDAAGNFYYAKSARHALPAVVPHHGTLLRVSADGTRTEIIAHGFRAANGVCLNDDGTFFVTDQEGHWTPKNRINHVVPDGGFYGNIFGFTHVTDTADTAMRPPLAWITNDKDRSPAELVRVPANTWGPLAGSLLNLSYGYGRISIVPHESVDGQLQGGICELPIPDFPTGVMRGRFHDNGALYTCGMVGWATNCREDGGFHRLRPTGRPARLPVGLASRPGALDLTFSEPIDADVTAGAFTATAWDLRRSADYGSPHLNEHPVAVVATHLSPDRRTITLDMPDLAPTRGLAITWSLRDPQGAPVTGSLHLTLHALGNDKTAAP